MTKSFLTIKEKLEIVNEAALGGMKACARKYNIQASQIRNWRNSIDLLMVDETGNQKTTHSGPLYRLLDPWDEEMLEEFNRLRDLGRLVNNKTMQRFYRRISTDYDTPPNRLSSTVHRWFRKHHLNLRRVTHTAQNTRYLEGTIHDFQVYVNDQLKSLGVSDDASVNMDETNVDFDCKTGQTYDRQGARTINLKVTGSSMRCTIILACTKSGKKLDGLIIYKGQPNGRISREWTVDGNLFPKDMVYCVQEKAWCDHRVMLLWIELIWQPFANKFAHCYLLWDQFKCHMMGDVIRKVQDCKTEVDFIPAGYTGRLQVCDVSINKPFKNGMRNEYESWMSDVPAGQEKVTRLLVATWCSNAWKAVTAESIINGWKKCITDVVTLEAIPHQIPFHDVTPDLVDAFYVDLLENDNLVEDTLVEDTLEE